jgi:hypothetical protein
LLPSTAPSPIVADTMEVSETSALSDPLPMAVSSELIEVCRAVNLSLSVLSSLDWAVRLVTSLLSCVIGSDAIATARVMIC